MFKIYLIIKTSHNIINNTTQFCFCCHQLTNEPADDNINRTDGVYVFIFKIS
jgi:hypothetical protein